MEYVCNKVMPKTVRPECNTLIFTYGPIIAQLLINEVESGEICKQLGLCPGDKSAPAMILTGAEENKLNSIQKNENSNLDNKNSVPLMDLAPAKTLISKPSKESLVLVKKTLKDDSLKCSLCIYVAELADNYLKQNKTVEEIVTELDLVCKWFPSSLTDQVN